MPAPSLRIQLPAERTGRIRSLGTIFLAWLRLMAWANLAAPLYARYAQVAPAPLVLSFLVAAGITAAQVVGVGLLGEALP